MLSLPDALELARQAWQQGDRARARQVYGQILAQVPDEPNALLSMAYLAFEEGAFDTAEEYGLRAIRAADGDPSGHDFLGLLRRRQGRPEEAVAAAQRAVELAPDWPQLHNNLGVSFKQALRWSEAEASFRRAFALAPNHDAAYNLANTLFTQGKLAEAETEFRRAIELSPREWEAHNNLGNVLLTVGRAAEALACFEQAIALEPNAAEAHRNRANLRMLLGDFERGWPEYEWRWRVPGNRGPNIQEPLWQGEPLGERTLVIYSEQGLGDAIQFIRYAAMVQAAHPKATIEFRVPAAWQRLLGTAPAVVRLSEHGSEPRPGALGVAILSLPTLLKATIASIPNQVPYLRAEPDRIEHWRRRLANVKKFKVGIAWQGSANYAGDRWRSIPLAEYAPLAKCPGVQLVGLQKHFGSEQLASFSHRDEVLDLNPEIDLEGFAFLDTAAVMQSLDLVITSDTAIAHLAGALGVPVWVALQFCPSWRWFLDRADSPFYPTMRLFRQQHFGAWSGAFAEMAGELTRLAALRGGSAGESR